MALVILSNVVFDSMSDLLLDFSDVLQASVCVRGCGGVGVGVVRNDLSHSRSMCMLWEEPT